jgi:hypothetical protein
MAMARAMPGGKSSRSGGGGMRRPDVVAEAQDGTFRRKQHLDWAGSGV